MVKAPVPSPRSMGKKTKSTGPITKAVMGQTFHKRMRKRWPQQVPVLDRDLRQGLVVGYGISFHR